MTFPYAPLLQPLQIGKLTIKNRFCVGPLTLPSLHGPFGEFSENGLAYFEERAKGGFGLIFTGAFHPDTLVDPVHPLDSKQPLKAPKSFQRSAVELLERLDAYGAKMMPQVSMGYGRNALGCFCPSEIPYYHDPARIAPALTKDQIKQKIDQMIATAVLLPFSGTLEKLATLTVRDNDTVERIDDFQLLDERFLSNPAFAVEQCKVVTDRMAELTREAIFDAINLIDGGAYTQEMADRVEALETKIDRYEDKLGTYMVKLSRAKLSQKDGHTLSLLLHSISDFERISDHAVNLMDSVQEMHDKKMSFSSAAAGELHVFADAVRDIVNRSFDSFLHDDVKLAKTVEPLEACIDDINVNVKSRHIERLTTGQCTIELGFVLTDISTNFERVSDHCSNIAVYQIQVPKDEYDTHEYLQNVKHQEHAEFDREEMAYEKRYRLPDVAKAQTAEAGE